MDFQSLKLIVSDRRDCYKGVIYRPFKVDKYFGLKRQALRVGISSFRYAGIFNSFFINTLLFLKCIVARRVSTDGFRLIAFHSNYTARSRELVESALLGIDIHLSADNSDECGSIFQALGFKERLSAYILTLLYLFKWFFFPGNMSRGILFVNSVDAYKLVCFYKFLRKIGQSGAKIVMTNHYDRWAYVSSQLENYGDMELSIVQHGFLDYNYILPNPCSSVTDLYVVDKKFEPQFRVFFSNIQNVILFRSKLNFVRVTEARSILILSSGQSIEQEQSILKEISKTVADDVVLIYKKHPLYEYPAITLNNLVLFDGVGVLPLSDLVICGESYLGYEYSSNGVVVVPLNSFRSIIRELGMNVEKAK